MHTNARPGAPASLRPARFRRTALALASLILAAFAVPTTTEAAASWCSSTVGTPTTSRPGTVVLADNFESGSLTTKWARTDEGDAWAGVTGSLRHTGLCAGRLVVTSSYTSRANVRKAMPYPTDEIWASGWFRVAEQGYSGSNVPTFRFFYGSSRILDVHRQNVSGDLWLRTSNGSGGWRYVKLYRKMDLYRWYRLEVHVRSAGSASLVSIWLDGTELYRNSYYWLPVSRLTTVMIGAEHVRQVMDMSFDDVVIKTL